MPNDGQKKANIKPKSDEKKENEKSSSSTQSAHEQKKAEVTSIKKEETVGAKSHIIKPQARKSQASQMQADEKKKTSKPTAISKQDKPEKDEKAKSKTQTQKQTSQPLKNQKCAKDQNATKNHSLAVYLWPVVCSVLTASALIMTKDMWMGTTSMSSVSQDVEDFVVYKKELSELQAQVNLLTEQLKNYPIKEASDKTKELQLALKEEAIDNIDEPQEITEEAMATENPESESTETVTEEAEEAQIVETPTEEQNQTERTEDAIAPFKQEGEEVTLDLIASNEPEGQVVTNVLEEKDGQIIEESAQEEPREVQRQADEALQAIEAQKQNVMSLETQIISLTQAVDTLQNQQPDMEVYEKRINEIEGQVEQVETQIQQVENKVEQLKTEVTDIQENISPTAMVATQYMAFDNLNTRIQSGENYKDALDAFEAVVPFDYPIGELRKYEEGVEPLHRLIADFKPISRTILIAERKARAKKEGQSQKLLSTFNELVTISRADGGQQGSPDRLVYNIEQALKNGNLKVVLTEMESATPEAQEAAQDWLSKVIIRQNIMENLSYLRKDLANEPGLIDKTAGE